MSRSGKKSAHHKLSAAVESLEMRQLLSGSFPLQALVIQDNNGNGIEDAGDTRIDDAQVYIDANNNGTLNTGETVAEQIDVGYYGFATLGFGTYTIRQVLRQGFNQTFPAANAAHTVTLSAASPTDTVIFGSRPDPALLGRVSGVVYNDLDGNGSRGGGEPGVSGRTVYADLNGDDTQDATDPSAVTDANGNYTIIGIPPGPTNIVQVVPDEFIATTPPNQTQRLNVVSQQTVTAAPFGSRKPNPTQYLDSTFGTNGQTVTIASSPINPRALQKLSDGKLIVAGVRDGRATVFRYNENGTLDTSFGGGNGFVQPNLPQGFVIGDMELLSDQRIVLGGSSSTSADLEVAVLTTAGALDTSFAGDGHTTVDFGGTVDNFADVAVTSNNNIALLGFRNTQADIETEIAVISPAGVLSNAFSSDGREVFNFNAFLDTPVALASESDGQLVVIGSRALTSRNVGLVFRINSNGTVDFTYGSGGTTVVETSNQSLMLADIAIQTNDRAVIVGTSDKIEVIRLTSNGSVDTGFGNNGRNAYTPIENGEELASARPRVSINASGRIAFGAIVGSAGELGIGLAILTPSGEFDTRYLRNGGLIQRFVDTANNSLADIVLRDDNKIVVLATVSGTVNTQGLLRTGDVVARATISGNVFSDTSNNGIRDNGETGSGAGRTVYVDFDNDGERDSGEPFTTTDAQGNFVISNLIATNYVVRLTTPGGFEQSYPLADGAFFISLFPGQTLPELNFGLHEIPPTIVATTGGPFAVFEGGSTQLFGSATGGPITSYEWDLDYDGTTFNIDSNQQNPFFAANDADGPATRTVALRARSGALAVSEIVTAQLTISNVAPTAVLNNSGPVGVGGSATVSFSQTSEPSLADRTAGLKFSFDFNNDGTFEIVNSSSSSATVPANLLTTVGTVLIAGVIADKDGGQSSYLTTLTVNNTPPTPTGATLRGTVFLDVDRDGIKDPGEAGVSGRAIYLDNNNNSVQNAGEQSTTTAADGTYQFTGLSSGTYKIRQILPSGSIQTTPTNNFGNNATVSTGQVRDGLNFGTAQNATPTGATIRGTVYFDVDRDGNFDAGESGIAGRTVYLDGNNNSILDGSERSAITNSVGIYEFTGLSAGTYKVRQVLPSGSIQTVPTNNFGNNVTLSSNQTRDGINFGSFQNTQPTGGTIRGTVFNDVDRDANFDAGESGIAGRTVYLDNNNNGTRDSNEPQAVTGSTGVYTFTGLAAGTYKVRQILPNGFSQTTPSNNFGNNVTLSTNQTRDGINFGSVATSTRDRLAASPLNNSNVKLGIINGLASDLFAQVPIL